MDMMYVPFALLLYQRHFMAQDKKDDKKDKKDKKDDKKDDKATGRFGTVPKPELTTSDMKWER